MNDEHASPEPPAGSSSPTGAPPQHAGAPFSTDGPTAGAPGSGPATGTGPGPQQGFPGQPGPHGYPGQPGQPAGPSGTDRFFDTVRRIGISRSDDRWIGGVAGGIAERFGIDPLIVRGILVISVFLTGAGLVLYGLAWALLPEARDGRIHLQQAIRGDFDVAMLGAAATTIVGLSWSNGWLAWWHFAGLEWLNGLLWAAAIIVVVVLVVNRRSDYRAHMAARAPAQQAPPVQHPSQAGPQRPPYGAPATGGQPMPGATYPAPPAAASGPAHHASAPLPPQGYPGQPPLPPQAFAAQQQAAAQAARAQEQARRNAQREQERQRRLDEQRARAARRPKGPGTAVVGTTLGLSLLGAAILMLLEHLGVIDVPFFYTWIGGTIILLGLGVVLSGLRGRTSGALGGLAIVATIIALPIAGWNSVDRFDADLTASVSDATYTVTSLQDAESGFSFTFGNPVVDLSQLDLSTVGEDPVIVPIDLSAGDLTVIVPADTPVEAEVRVLAGNASWDVDGQRRAIAGVNTRPHTFVTDSVSDGAGPVLLLEVDVAAGDVSIREES
ncbi:PspC domain-containing protein [Oerskovia turbata]